MGKNLRLGSPAPNHQPASIPMIRVLHADDDPQIAEMVRLLFSRSGKDCLLDHVPDGRSCLDAMEKTKYDVLLVDLVMPDIDGLRVLGELTARHDPTPVVMVSGQGQHELAVRALRAGAVDCLDKNSADFRRLPDIARRVVERNRRKLSVATAPRDHRVLFVEPDPQTRELVSRFFAADSSRLVIEQIDVEKLEQLLLSTFDIDAVVLGPGIQEDVMLDTLRHLRSAADDIPALVLSGSSSRETGIAAFQLGAHDYLFFQNGCLPELVFSLNHALKRADTERLNTRLSAELAELNRSLADQVADRTRDLQAQIAVREAAERRAEDNAARLQALSTRLLRVQEDERHAIARELHDQVGQLLTGLRFQLEAARSQPTALADALSVTDDLLKTVREMTLQLRPRMLDDFGLRPALEWHVNRFRHQTNINVELDIALPEGRLSSVLETTVYRITQEALTNVARHAGAPSAIVTVTADDQSLHVEISDRGRGFDTVAALAKHNSIGLAGLAERVHLAGGTLELFSRIGQGTRIHAEFPMMAATPAPFPTAPAS
jgi:signal transduction histidine kinase